MELFVHDNYWVFFPVTVGEGPCPASCPTKIIGDVEWFANLTTNRFFGTSLKLLIDTNLKCLQRQNRFECFTKGQRLRKEMLKEDLAPIVKANPIIGTFRAQCGTGKTESSKAPFTKTPGSSKPRDRKDSTSTAQIKSWYTS